MKLIFLHIAIIVTASFVENMPFSLNYPEVFVKNQMTVCVGVSTDSLLFLLFIVVYFPLRVDCHSS